VTAGVPDERCRLRRGVGAAKLGSMYLPGRRVGVAVLLAAGACAVNRAEIEQELDSQLTSPPGAPPLFEDELYNPGIGKVRARGRAALPALMRIVRDYRSASVAYVSERTEANRKRYWIRHEALGVLGTMIESDDDGREAVSILEAVALCEFRKSWPPSFRKIWPVVRPGVPAEGGDVRDGEATQRAGAA